VDFGGIIAKPTQPVSKLITPKKTEQSFKFQSCQTKQKSNWNLFLVEIYGVQSIKVSTPTNKKKNIDFWLASRLERFLSFQKVSKSNDFQKDALVFSRLQKMCVPVKRLDFHFLEYIGT